MFPELQFREYYSHMADDELARLALESELVPEARQALAQELDSRGLTDLQEYKRALDEVAAARREESEENVRLLPVHAFLIVPALYRMSGSVLGISGPQVLLVIVAVSGLMASAFYMLQRARIDRGQIERRLALLVTVLGVVTIVAAVLVVQKAHP